MVLRQMRIGRRGGEGMKLPYCAELFDSETERAARRVVELLLESKLTYKKSIQALECAQTLLGETKPSTE